MGKKIDTIVTAITRDLTGLQSFDVVGISTGDLTAILARLEKLEKRNKKRKAHEIKHV